VKLESRGLAGFARPGRNLRGGEGGGVLGTETTIGRAPIDTARNDADVLTGANHGFVSKKTASGVS
jgi:hypothetical protein